MARSRTRFARAVDKRGKTVMELHAPLPNDDALSIALRVLTHQIGAKGIANAEGGGFGGEYGYGANYENDVFLMHRYCGCERDDCLWCGSGCQATIERRPHSADCYQSHLDTLRRKYGRRMDSGWYHVSYGGKKYQAYENAKRALCRRLRRSFKRGNEVHCTCGSDADRKRRFDACECDWHMGRGIYRFGKAVNAPHFWHKPSALQVRWYKYIGRDMEVAEPIPDVSLRDVLSSCLESIGATIDTSVKAYERDERESQERFRQMMQAAFASVSHG